MNDSGISLNFASAEQLCNLETTRFLTTPTEKKLYEIIQERWCRMAEEELRQPVIRIRHITEKWKSHLAGLGMRFRKARTLPPEPRETGDSKHYIIDPSSQLDPTYIVIEPETANKILVLGYLP